MLEIIGGIVVFLIVAMFIAAYGRFLFASFLVIYFSYLIHDLIASPWGPSQKQSALLVFLFVFVSLLLTLLCAKDRRDAKKLSQFEQQDQ